MGCVTPISIVAVLAIISIASGNWGLAILFILAAPVITVITAASKPRRP